MLLFAFSVVLISLEWMSGKKEGTSVGFHSDGHRRIGKYRYRAEFGGPQQVSDDNDSLGKHLHLSSARKIIRFYVNALGAKPCNAVGIDKNLLSMPCTSSHPVRRE